MATLNRFTIDLVTDEPLSERRLQTIAREMSEWVHLLGVENDDEMINVSEKLAMGHAHDSTEDQCRVCNYASYDSRNGDQLVG